MLRKTLTMIAINSEEDLARVEKTVIPALLCTSNAQGGGRQLRTMSRGEDAAKRLSSGDTMGAARFHLVAKGR